MQRMIPHDVPLPPCTTGHAARHMHDRRGRHCGGGHFVECACSHTDRHDDFNAAVAQWARMQGVLPAVSGSVVTFPRRARS